MLEVAKAAKKKGTFGSKVSVQSAYDVKSQKKNRMMNEACNDFEVRARELQERYLGTSAYKDSRKREKGPGIVLRAPILADRVTSAIKAHKQRFDPFFADLDASLDCIEDKSSISTASDAKNPGHEKLNSSIGSKYSSNIYEVLAESDDTDEESRGITFAPSILAANFSAPKVLSPPHGSSSFPVNTVKWSNSLPENGFIPTDNDENDDDL